MPHRKQLSHLPALLATFVIALAPVACGDDEGASGSEGITTAAGSSPSSTAGDMSAGSDDSAASGYFVTNKLGGNLFGNVSAKALPGMLL